MNSLSFAERLARIEEDNHHKREEIEKNLPYAVTLGLWKIHDEIEAKNWCREHIGGPKMSLVNGPGLWTCDAYMAYVPRRVFRFANDVHAVEFKLRFG